MAGDLFLGLMAGLLFGFIAGAALAAMAIGLVFPFAVLQRAKRRRGRELHARMVPYLDAGFNERNAKEQAERDLTREGQAFALELHT